MKLDLKKLATGKDALTGKEGEGVIVGLESGKSRFFVWASLRKFIQMELSEPEKPVANGQPEPLFDKVKM